MTAMAASRRASGQKRTGDTMNEIVEHSNVPQTMDAPMSVRAVHDQVQAIQALMLSEMKDGTHYGKIDGCGDNPALLKAGAEKLCMLFRMAPRYEIEDKGEDGERRYIVRTKLFSIHSGAFLGEGIGEASTLEEKYAWVKAYDDQYDAELDPSRKRIKSYGQDKQVKQIRANVADRSNTVLKMAKKRSLIDAVLTVTAASDMFNQDLDDDDVANMVREQEQAKQTTKKKASEKPKPCPSMRYGAHKGKRFDDASIPTQYLEWMLNKTKEGLGSDARKQYQAEDKLTINALEQEIAARRAKDEPPGQQPPAQPDQSGPPPGQGPRGQMDDGTWADLKLVMEEQCPKECEAVLIAMGLKRLDDVATSKRWTFYEQVQALVGKRG